MLQLQQGPLASNCQGMTRRTALKAGFLGVLGLSLPDMLRMRAEGSATRDTSNAAAKLVRASARRPARWNISAPRSVAVAADVASCTNSNS